MLNPIEIIKQDHRKSEALFKEYEDIDEEAFAARERSAKKLRDELRLHMDMEESIFYPRLEEKFNKEDDKMVEEAYTEHDVMRRLLEELSVTHPEDPRFDARVKVLSEMVAHHVLEEEQELLPEVEKELSAEELNNLGELMEAYKIEHSTATRD